jgi:hypothetical protein
MASTSTKGPPAWGDVPERPKAAYSPPERKAAAGRRTAPLTTECEVLLAVMNVALVNPWLERAVRGALHRGESALRPGVSVAGNLVQSRFGRVPGEHLLDTPGSPVDLSGAVSFTAIALLHWTTPERAAGSRGCP